MAKVEIELSEIERIRESEKHLKMQVEKPKADLSKCQDSNLEEVMIETESNKIRIHKGYKLKLAWSDKSSAGVLVNGSRDSYGFINGFDIENAFSRAFDYVDALIRVREKPFKYLGYQIVIPHHRGDYTSVLINGKLGKKICPIFISEDYEDAVSLAKKEIDEYVSESIILLEAKERHHE